MNYAIQSKAFTAIQNDFGLQLAPQVPLWVLQDTVVPTVLFGQDIFPGVNSWDPVFEDPETSGTQTNPGVAVLVEKVANAITVPVNCDWKIIATSRAVFAGGSHLLLQKRNAANSANVWEIPILPIPSANDIPTWIELNVAFPISPGERVRVTTEDAITGDVSASLFFRVRPSVPPFSRPAL